MGQTRWPSIFSSLDVIGSHKKQTKLKYFFQIEDFGFPVSREDAYYQFYKNAPTVGIRQFRPKATVGIRQFRPTATVGIHQSKPSEFLQYLLA